MEYAPLGDSDLRVSEICLGTWTTFGESVGDDVAVTLVDTAFEVGINFFDTANVYGVPAGRAEEALGRALQGRATRSSWRPRSAGRCRTAIAASRASRS